MAVPAARPLHKRRPTSLEVLRTELITPHMVRITAGGPGFAGLTHNGFTDRYVKLLFLSPDVTYPEPFDRDVIEATMPRDAWPVTRTYTVRRVDRQAGEIAIDVVLHGDEGLAGPWAARARPGDVVRFYGPGGAYSPSPDADWHLLAGDEAALPAIAAALEAMPAGVPVHAFIEVDSAAEEQVIDCPGELSLTWLHRNGAPAGDVSSIVNAVKGAPWPAGTPHVFVHGESGLIKGLRSYFRNERGVPGDLLSLSGYWRTGLVEPDFQAWKAEQKNADVQAATR